VPAFSLNSAVELYLRGFFKGGMVVQSFAILIASLFVWSAFAGPVEEFYEKSLYKLEPNSALDYASFENIIATNQLQTLEGTLEYFKKYFPDFFENYILMYHSRSLQTSSFENPRAILFDRSGHFVFSFNGDHKHRGYYNLEIMHFLPEQKRFEFREVSFSPNGDRPPQFSKPNPAKCMACHQSNIRQKNDPRPNWEPYNVWPGAFGSINGNLKPLPYDLRQAKDRGLAREMIAKAEMEEAKYKTFETSTKPHHPRYKWLSEKFRAKNTTEFTEILAAPTALRVGRLLSEEVDPRLMEYLKYPLLGFLRCGHIMMADDKYQWLQQSLQILVRKAETSSTHFGEVSNHWSIPQALDKRYKGLYKNPLLHEKIEAQKVQYVAEAARQRDEFRRMKISNGLILLLEPFGISTTDWSMDFQTEGQFAFSERFGVPGIAYQTLQMGYRDEFGFWEGQDICVEIGVKSKQAVNDLFASPHFNEFVQQRDVLEKAQNTPLINRCIKCHSSGDYSIPQIPFDDPANLKTALTKKSISSHRTLLEEIKHRTGPFAEAHERMPIGITPSPHQTKELISFLTGHFPVNSAAPPDTENRPQHNY
jgi:hypothetical protein